MENGGCSEDLTLERHDWIQDILTPSILHIPSFPVFLGSEERDGLEGGCCRSLSVYYWCCSLEPFLQAWGKKWNPENKEAWSDHILSGDSALPLQELWWLRQESCRERWSCLSTKHFHCLMCLFNHTLHRSIHPQNNQTVSRSYYNLITTFVVITFAYPAVRTVTSASTKPQTSFKTAIWGMSKTCSGFQSSAVSWLTPHCYQDLPGWNYRWPCWGRFVQAAVTSSAGWWRHPSPYETPALTPWLCSKPLLNYNVGSSAQCGPTIVTFWWRAGSICFCLHSMSSKQLADAWLC